MAIVEVDGGQERIGCCANAHPDNVAESVGDEVELFGGGLVGSRWRVVIRCCVELRLQKDVRDERGGEEAQIGDEA